jgi:hypothetical protein
MGSLMLSIFCLQLNVMLNYFATFLAGIKGTMITAKNRATSNTINMILIF